MTEMQNGTPLHNSVSEHDTQSHDHTVNGYATPTSQPDPTASTDTSQRIQRHNAAGLQDEILPEHVPNKKRKLTDSEIRKAIGQRPVSPPWKRVIIDGPTSFVEEGRRKSSRTNFVPIELQPSSDKRRTRGAGSHTAPLIQSKYGGASVHKTGTIPAATSSKAPRKSSTPARSSFSTPKSPARSSTRPSLQQSPHKPPQDAPVRTKRPYNRRVPLDQASTVKPPSHDPNAPPKRKVGRPPSAKKLLSQTQGASASGWQTDGPSFDQEDVRESKSVGGEPRIQRLNLRFRAPAGSVQHPGHIVQRQMVDEKVGDTVLKRPKYSSFEDWLEREGRLGLETGEADPRLTHEEVFQEASLRSRIVQAARPGGILSEERCSFFKTDDSEEPPRLYTHQDRLISHARYFQKLMSQERNKHLRAAKDCAEKAAAFVKAREERAYQQWKEVQPKTAEEIRREQDESFKAIYIQLKEDIKRKWGMVFEIVEQQRQRRWEEEQERLGTEVLNEVIENARGSLKKRRKRLSEMGSDDEGSHEAATASEPSEGDPSETSHEDESNMSSSESESEADEGGIGEKDENLTVEELREKYASLPAGNLRPNTPPVEEDSTTRSDIPTTIPMPTMPLEPPLLQADVSSTIDQPYRTQREPNHEEPSDMLLDESDHSTDMEDDEDEEDESEDMSATGSSSEEESDESDEARPGLLGFYGKQAFEQGIQEDEMEIEKNDQMLSEHDPEEISRTSNAVHQPIQGPTPSATTSEEPRLQSQLDDAEAMNGEKQDPDQNRSAQEIAVGADRSISLPNAVSSSPPLISSLIESSLPITPVSTKSITTPVPALLRGTLREYQHFGLDWLAKLYRNHEHGILADEMGLGKTIQTIALLAHLAVEYEVWGPHLIVVPTSVMLNWEMEFKKFLPGFKVLTYYGTLEERKKKRQGITDNDKWNVWITSYQLVTNDQQVFKKKAWHYMVLDEAHNIKNFRSLRWQTLLNFRTHSRLLLTGTPLQNNLTELWSLLFFIQPEKFFDLDQFNAYFKRPESQILESGRDAMNSQSREMVMKLHEVLRPHLLRRLKSEVEKQLPGKYEHVVYCRLSKRQRHLYDGFMSRAQTRESLASGNTFSIMNALMQLRKVCNHPDLFETHPVKTSFAMSKSVVADFEIKELLTRRRLLKNDPMALVDLSMINMLPGRNEHFSALDTIQRQRLGALGALRQLASQQWQRIKHGMEFDGSTVQSNLDFFKNSAKHARFEDLRHHAYLTSLRSQRRPLLSYALTAQLRLLDRRILPHPPMPRKRAHWSEWLTQTSPAVCDMVKTIPDRSASLETIISKFACIPPKVVATDLTSHALTPVGMNAVEDVKGLCPQDPYHEARVRLSIAFPDKRLLQYDCGKLQRLDGLLRNLQSGGHRALIFTQMTKVLDILEQFLNIHGHRYLRLDGATKVDQRQALTERFNNDSRILAFILSSRSGGIGINLTGADTVIFYDMDWNPAMDKQCQDRCHRIGQTRDVHIYRMISEHTIEANILRKANQKRMLDDVVIQEGDFTTDYLHNLTVKDVIGDEHAALVEGADGADKDSQANSAMDRVLGAVRGTGGKVLEQVEDVEDIQAAKLAEREIEQNQDAADFDERALSAGTNTPKTPATPNELMPPPQSTSALNSTRGDVERTATMDVIDSGLGGVPFVDDYDQENEGPSCDDYMVRFLEWELRDVPVQAAEEQKRKKAKKGKEHIIRKR